MTAPPLPFIPAAHHGKLLVMILLCYAGDVEAGTRAIVTAAGRILANVSAFYTGPDRSIREA